jgi:putative ABC transport system permease protein
VVYVGKWPWEFGGDYAWWKYISRPVPTYSDYMAVKDKSELADAVCFTAAMGNRTIKYKSNSISKVRLMGVSNEWDHVRDIKFGEGRYFSFNESLKGAHVCLIGVEVAEALLGEEYPIGKYIKIMGINTKIIGVFEREGSSMINNSLDNQIIIPVNYFRSVFNIERESAYPFIIVKGKQNVPVADVKSELRGIMRGVRKLRPLADDNFALNQISLLDNFLKMIFSTMSLVSWIIGGFSLLVGAFGIANIMFVSVRERTGIIGIQKALGAKNYFLLFQFLVESITLCLIGGLFGLILVYITISIINSVAYDSLGFEIFLSVKNITVAMMVSLITGVLAGIIPAIQASKMDPVEAIRFNG